MKKHTLWNDLLLSFIPKLPESYIGYIFINILLFIPCISILILHVLSIFNILQSDIELPYKTIYDKIGLLFESIFGLMVIVLLLAICTLFYHFVKILLFIIFSKTFLIALLIVLVLYVIKLVYNTLETLNFKKITWK